MVIKEIIVELLVCQHLSVRVLYTGIGLVGSNGTALATFIPKSTLTTLRIWKTVLVVPWTTLTCTPKFINHQEDETCAAY